MQLTTMQDIGGCRAIVSSVDEVERVVRRCTAVEEVGSNIGSDLKSGKGPPEVLRLFVLLGAVLALAENEASDDGGIYNALVDAVRDVPESVLEMIGLEQITTDGVLVLNERFGNSG